MFVMKKTQVILFDFGGTLDSDGIDWFTRIYLNAAGQIGPINREAFDKCAKHAADGIAELDDTPQLNIDQTARRICEHIYVEMNQDNGFGSDWHEKVSKWNPHETAEEFITQAHVCLKRNLDVLHQLSHTFRLGCISNNWGNTAGWCRQFQLDRYFETIIDSTVVGAVKPDKTIFQAALNELQVSPDKCVYVGDKYDYDVLGAHAVGMTPVWLINDNGDSFDADNLSITPLRIKQLPDLITMNWQ